MQPDPECAKCGGKGHLKVSKAGHRSELFPPRWTALSHDRSEAVASDLQGGNNAARSLISNSPSCQGLAPLYLRGWWSLPSPNSSGVAQRLESKPMSSASACEPKIT